VDFCRQWWKAGQIEGQATDHGALVGGRRWLKSSGFQTRADESVDRFFAPRKRRGSGVFGGGLLNSIERCLPPKTPDPVLLQGLIGPMGAALGQIEVVAGTRAGEARIIVGRQWSAELDPGDEIGD